MSLESAISSLEVGKKADLVVFDFRRPHLDPAVNPASTLAHTGQGGDVEMVMVEGRFVVENGNLILADMKSMLSDAQKAANRLGARVGS